MYPQIVRVAEKIIWEEQAPMAGVPLLAAIGSREAYAALRRFGLSQAGPDEARIDALTRLVDAGEIEPGEECRVWLAGEWRLVAPSTFEAIEEPEYDYTPEVQDLLAAASLTMAAEELDTAEDLLLKVLELEPAAKEAYNNLAAIYLRREDRAQGIAMYEAALRIDPTYVFSRGGLAVLRLQDRDVAGAREILRPLADAPEPQGLGLAFMSYIRARIAVEEKDYAAARTHLGTSLDAVPGYGLALNLLDALDDYDEEVAHFRRLRDGQREQWARRRARLQSAITTRAPSLHEALSVHTKASLTAMARLSPVSSGWSTLRKAELLDEIERALCNEVAMRWQVTFASDEEREALAFVLDKGGSVPWDEFSEQFGHDLDEYPHWEYEEPETTMGLLRAKGLLAEATVDNALIITIPRELRPILREALL
jgi:tetratricopeptide (TPR) repeat protein